MPIDTTATQWDSEVYFANDLTAEELDAISVLSGVHSDRSPPDDAKLDNLGREPSSELSCFLMNAVIFWRRGGFAQKKIKSFEDLATFGDYLLDAAHLLTQRQTPDIPTMVIASLAASLMVDAQSSADPEAAFHDAFQECHDRAQELVSSLVRVQPGH